MCRCRALRNAGGCAIPPKVGRAGAGAGRGREEARRGGRRRRPRLGSRHHRSGASPGPGDAVSQPPPPAPHLPGVARGRGLSGRASPPLRQHPPTFFPGLPLQRAELPPAERAHDARAWAPPPPGAAASAGGGGRRSRRAPGGGRQTDPAAAHRGDPPGAQEVPFGRVEEAATLGPALHSGPQGGVGLPGLSRGAESG